MEGFEGRRLWQLHRQSPSRIAQTSTAVFLQASLRRWLRRCLPSPLEATITRHERLQHVRDQLLCIERLAIRLSGGERQRLTIARAILSNAPIVVLDEATASLDPDSESAVQSALAELAAGKTVLIIAHRLHTIAGANQIIVLDGGQVVERGAHQDLIARDGLYAWMWRAQQDGAAA